MQQNDKFHGFHALEGEAAEQDKQTMHTVLDALPGTKICRQRNILVSASGKQPFSISKTTDSCKHFCLIFKSRQI